MSDEFRIEKTRLAVTVRLRGGTALDGDIFIQPSLYMREGPEEPGDILNSSDPFFPMQMESGGTVLVAKGHVLELLPDEPLHVDELRRASARDIQVELILEDSTVRCGTLLVEMPHDRPRVLDFLNDCRERFLTLHGGDGTFLVNVDAIARVRPLD